MVDVTVASLVWYCCFVHCIASRHVKKQMADDRNSVNELLCWLNSGEFMHS